MNNQETTLPEKCCAKCGFFYGHTTKSVSRVTDAVFDPDILRNETFLENIAKENRNHQMVISTYRKPESGTLQANHLYKDATFYCFHRRFSQKRININSDNQLDTVIKEIHDLTRTDREQLCGEYFFPYRPGFSAKEHAEIRLQEKREAVLDEYWERDNFRENLLGIITIILTITSINLAYLYGAK